MLHCCSLSPITAAREHRLRESNVLYMLTADLRKHQQLSSCLQTGNHSLANYSLQSDIPRPSIPVPDSVMFLSLQKDTDPML